jgi:hypothetical protein
MELVHKGVPQKALPVLAEHLRAHGATVHFETDTRGYVHSIAGKLTWEHANETLTIRLVENAGHFPRLLLIGGMRQAIQEAVELAG